MKRIIIYLSILVAFMLSVELADAALYRKTANGGPDGYKYTREIWLLYISCWDPGTESCPKSITDTTGGNSTPPHQVVAMDYALDQIANGNLTGNEVHGNTNIEWTATTTDGTNSVIKIWDNDEDEPLDDPPATP